MPIEWVVVVSNDDFFVFKSACLISLTQKKEQQGVEQKNGDSYFFLRQIKNKKVTSATA